MSDRKCEVCIAHGNGHYCPLHFFNGVPLDEHCTACNGEGTGYDANDKYWRCDECDGEGIVMTQDGIELRNFVKEYVKFSVTSRVN